MSSSPSPKRTKYDKEHRDLPVATFDPSFHPSEAKKMKYRPLGNTGLNVSILSFGASSLGSVFHETDDTNSKEVVQFALKSGINLIDTAPWYGYGKSERILGEALRNVPRHCYYLTTKVGRYEPDVLKMFDFRAERVLRSVNESLARLGLDYVDVIQVHDPEFCPNIDIILSETLPALQKVKDSGKARFIGMTGYPLNLQKEIIEKSPVKIDTSLTYCHYSLNDVSLQTDFLPFAKEKGIGLINASPFSMGLLSNRGPPSWHPAPPRIREPCKQAAAYCEQHGVDISRLALHFSLANDQIPTTLFSSADLQRTKENIDSLFHPLSETETKVMNQIVEKYFKPLYANPTWEGEEVKQYWVNVGKKLLLQTLYGKK